MTRLIVAAAVVAAVLTGCKKGEEWILPNQSSSEYVSTR